MSDVVTCSSPELPTSTSGDDDNGHEKTPTVTPNHDTAPYRPAHNETHSEDNNDHQTPRTRVGLKDSTALMEKRVAQLLKATHVGSHCAVTRDRLAVEYAHVLAKQTKDEFLNPLEFAWGLSYRTLNTNSRYNIIKLDSSLHTILDKKMIILLPEESRVRELLCLYGLESNTSTADSEPHSDAVEDEPQDHDQWNYSSAASHNASSSNKIDPSTIYEPVATYEYTIVGSELMRHRVIVRLDPAPANDSIPLDPCTVQQHVYPYATLPPVIATVRPYFVICHIGKLLDPYGKQQGLRNFENDTFDLIHGYNGRFAARILDCLQLWAHWRNSSPPDEFSMTPKKVTGATHKSDVTSQRRASTIASERAKRTRSGVLFTIQHDAGGIESSPEEAPLRKIRKRGRPSEPSPSVRSSRRG